MAKFVRFNVTCGVSGVTKMAGDEEFIDDKDFDQLKLMFRANNPYVEELPIPRNVRKKVPRKPKRKKQNAKAKRGENAVK